MRDKFFATRAVLQPSFVASESPGGMSRERRRAIDPVLPLLLDLSQGERVNRKTPATPDACLETSSCRDRKKWIRLTLEVDLRHGARHRHFQIGPES